MTHLKIELNNGITEQVSPSVIEKLYEIVHSGNLDSSSNLIGSLNTTSTYLDYVDYLEELFTKNGIRLLVITANKLYISFADPEVLRVLTSKYGDGIGIQRSDLEGVSMLPYGCFDGNTTIETFDELGLFPSVVSLNYDTFRNCSNLKSVDLSNITTFLGGNIFAGCTNLGSTNNGILNLPKLNSLSNGNGIFNSCSSLVEVNIGSLLSNAERTTVIPGSFFYNCTNLEKVTGLNMILHLKGSAFYNCYKLESIDITSNLTTLDAECFFECRSLLCIDLSNVTTLNNNGHFRGCTSLVDLTTSDPTLINTGAATYTFNWSTIPNQVFVNCKLTNKSFSFPNATSIGSSSFYGSGIVGITFPNVTTIGDSAFYGCNKLTSVDLSSCTSISSLAFNNCSLLTTVGDLSNVISIGNNAFQNCSSLTTIGNLSNCTSIGRSAFSNCSNLDKTDLNLSNVTYLGLYSFNECSKLKGTLNLSGVLTIDALTTGLFSGCSGLLKIILGHVSSVETSRMNANRSTFYQCDSLKVVDINLLDSITFSDLILIDNNVFLAFIIRNTNTIPTITLDLGITYAAWSKFTSSSNAKIYVADSLYSTYINHADWSDLASHIEPLSNYVES